MRTEKFAPTVVALPAELPVVHFEALAAQMHDSESRRLIGRLAKSLMNFWTETGPALVRESRQKAMHPDHPKAEGLRELGLEPFLGR